jgi:hypothetical protein
MGKWVDQGETKLANVFFKSAARGTLYLGLYENSTEPLETATLTNITESTAPGYSRITLSDTDWTVSGNTVTMAQKTFTFTGSGNTIYGAFITDGTDLIAVDHFDSPFTPAANGDQLKVTFTITID